MSAVVVAHGGTGGAIVELVVIGGILALLAATWLRGRHRADDADDADPDG